MTGGIAHLQQPLTKRQQRNARINQIGSIAQRRDAILRKPICAATKHALLELSIECRMRQLDAMAAAIKAKAEHYERVLSSSTRSQKRAV